MSRIYNFCLFVASRSHNQNKSTEEHRMSLGAGEDKVAVSDSVSVTTHKAHSHSHSVSGTLLLSHTLNLILLNLCVVLLITFGSAHDVAGNASKLKLPEAQSWLGLARLRLTHWKSLSLCRESLRSPKKHWHYATNGWTFKHLWPASSGR